MSKVLAQSDSGAKNDVTYVAQTLSPTSAIIQRPQDWFYAEDHSTKARTWTVTLEDVSGNRPYVTGVKTEVRFDVSKTLGTTPKAFATKFIEARSTALGVKLVGKSKETTVGPFKNVSFEIEQEGNHISHMVFWGTGKFDTLVFITRGTTKKLWKTHKAALFKAGQCDLSKLILPSSKLNKTGMQPMSLDGIKLLGQLTKLGFDVVPLERMKTGHLVVSANVNNSKLLRFLCDSGANRTILTPETCNLLDLETSPSDGSTSGAGGKLLNVEKTKLDLFQIGKSKVSFSKVLVVDLAQLNKTIVSDGGKPVDGIVGSDWLKGRKALIDVGSARLFYKRRKK